MDNLTKIRLGIISKFTQEKQSVGKTAMMKYLFLLQEVYDAPLNYDFQIYTYGPYSNEVMGDIDLANYCGAISMKTYTHSTGVGYELMPTENTEQLIQEEKEFIDTQEESINEIMKIFGGKNAKSLELISTIIYLYKQYVKNNWNASSDDIATKVHEIKPHFTKQEIIQELVSLKHLGVLKRVA